MTKAMRVLVVDDSTLARQVVRSILGDLGHPDIAEARDGEEALALLEQAPFDLVISDDAMPGLDGLGLLRGLQEGSTRAVPVLMLGEARNVEHIVELMKAGAYGFLKKPFTLAALQAKLTEVQKKQQLAQAPQSGSLSGSLEEIGVSELVQFLHSQRASGRLVIKAGDGEGTIEIRDGEVRAARFQGESGATAFCALAGSERGRFHFVRWREPVDPEIEGGTLALLLEALRLKDERGRSSQPLS